MRTGLTASLLALVLTATLAHAEDDWGDDAWGDEEENGPVLHGFIEGAVGGRTSSDPALIDDDLTLAEIRARLESETYLGETRLSGKLDLYTDAADGGDNGLQLNLREAVAEFSLTDNVDMRVGHQILTWGTGDLVFLNDLFAKGWVSFFSGRDDEYLKAPSTSVKWSVYGENANLDFVWTPVFAHDEFIEGERFSYFSPLASSQVSAPVGKVIPEEPSESFSNGEFAARLYGTTSLLGSNSTEWALYGYRGFWKQPNAINSSMQPYFSRLNVLGASLRTNIASGIGHTEFAWYNGADDAGSDPLLPNNQIRFLVGYEQELIPKLTLGLQYYLEHIQDYDALAANDGNSPYRPDENRSLWTMRLTYHAMQDNLTLSWFSFYSPTDQ
ncbi:MAG: hypothetical protein ACPGAE_14075, partial [Neptuniibacter sp.]